MQSEAFRKRFSIESSKLLGTTVEVAPFDWRGFTVATESLEATGDGVLAKVCARGLTSKIGLSAVHLGDWRIHDSSVNRMEVSLDGSKWPVGKSAGEMPRAARVGQSPVSNWLPSRTEFQDLRVDNFVVNAQLQGGLASATGMTLKVEPGDSKDAYDVKFHDSGTDLNGADVSGEADADGDSNRPPQEPPAE